MKAEEREIKTTLEGRREARNKNGKTSVRKTNGGKGGGEGGNPNTKERNGSALHVKRCSFPLRRRMKRKVHGGTVAPPSAREAKWMEIVPPLRSLAPNPAPTAHHEAELLPLPGPPLSGV